jgi:hypothetical protein
MLKTIVRYGAALVPVLWASAAQAQEEGAVAEEQVSAGFLEGGGVKLSEDLVLHPRFELQTGYQSNVFREDGAGANEAVGSALMRLVAGGALSNSGTVGTGNRALLLNGSLDLTWNQFLSGNDVVTGYSDLGIGAALDLKFNPEGRVTFGVRDAFVRSVLPPPSETPDADIDRDKNEITAIVTYKPGGGAIQIYGQFSNSIELFEDSRLDFANRMTNTVTVGGRWQWLPKTSFSSEASLGFVTVDSQALKSSSMPLRITVGANTLITPRIGTVVRVGYANAFYDSGQSFSNIVFSGELRYAFGPTMRISGGYAYDFTDSLIANFYTDHTLYGRLVAQFGGKVSLNGRLEFKLRNYGGVPTMTVQGTDFCGDTACVRDRSDVIVGSNIGLDYQMNPWLYLGAAYTLYSDSTDFFTRSTGSMDDPAKYVWQEFMVKAAAKF